MTDHLRDTLQGALGSGHRIERELGGGGMSRVFVARDLSLDRDIVVKVLPGESTHGVNADRFRREIQVIARLQHPHIIPILAAGSAEGTLYYLMPFMGGETLRARLSREGPLSVPDTARILREVLDALGFAHKHGVIHRDIKPENVLLEAGHAVVADFGIAKALRDSGNVTSAGISLGTPAYAAPEQAMADPATDHRADLYAVGAMAYEMLSGAPVFSGSVQQVVAAHLTTAPVPLRDRRSDIPAPLAEVIMRALAKEPAERPQSAGEMLAALDAAVTPVATTPMPAAGAARPSRVRQYAAIGGIALVAVTAFLIWRDRAPRPSVVEGAEVIAVLPLAAVSDSSLARLGEDLVVTLSSTFDGVGSLRTTDAVTVLSNARKLEQPIPLADALQLGRKLGAQSVLTGTLISEGANVRASVALYRVDGDSAIAKATVLAPPSAIAALTDSLAWQVLRQVWRRGQAPSPVLTGLMTSSFDALRAFLDGERAWQHLDVDRAKAMYRRAFELDSNFAQAYMRHYVTTTWHGVAPDSIVRRRLLELRDRLPAREREFVEIRTASMSTPRRIAAWKDYAARYPDHTPALMAAADPIIHNGPLFGIPMSEARQFIDRMIELAPDDGDARLHQAFVAYADGRLEDARRAMYALDTITAGTGYTVLPWGFMFGMRDEAHRLTNARADSMMRIILNNARPAPEQGIFAGALSAEVDAEVSAAQLRRLRNAGALQGEENVRSYIGEGAALASRGRWTQGLDALRRGEAADLPMSLRMSSARLAALGAWLGAVDAATADAILQRVRTIPGIDSTTYVRAELQFADGLIGVASGDESRVRRALQAFPADTTPYVRNAARSLRGLWLARSNPDAAADSLRAVSDDVMANGGFMFPAEAAGRLVVARALRRRGQPEAADRYVRWIEAGIASPLGSTTHFVMQPLVMYERGIAQDEAGEKRLAVWNLQRFVDMYTDPPEAHKPLVEDAKKRLTRLTGTDAPK